MKAIYRSANGEAVYTVSFAGLLAGNVPELKIPRLDELCKSLASGDENPYLVQIGILGNVYEAKVYELSKGHCFFHPYRDGKLDTCRSHHARLLISRHFEGNLDRNPYFWPEIGDLILSDIVELGLGHQPGGLARLKELLKN